MNEIDAIRLMVSHYPGGCEAIAPRIGKPCSTLQKELREAPGFKLGHRECGAIAELCCELDTPHCRAYATAVAARCGLHVTDRPDAPGDGDVATLLAARGA